ncbi:MAG: dihydroorotate dehydrogenase electron transfer subunit [Streptosporangiales bacterium]|nr:dihydroorotate dehydrogenase electron transfer subunit [Streptosporangiales bacterium]
MMLRRCFSLYAGDAGGTIEFVFATHGKGTRWLAERRAGDTVDVVGPLGRPFPLPETPRACVLVGGGYGSAPLFALGAALRAGGSAAHLVVGAASADRLFAGDDADRTFASVTVTTDDGSAGTRGMVTDVLPDLFAASGAARLYACGPMAMLAACTRAAEAAGVTAYTAVEEAMACGVGVCMTCVLPVVGDDGVTRMTRSCTEGPVFRGDRVRWADVGTVPADTWGAGVH